jgi:NAD(P)-dependent dehydrogenase (short-subunit alcohol dehydrogenase family)
MKRRQLKDMVTVIAGASSGIGRALAVELATQGGHLVLGARRINRLNELNSQLGGGHVCVEMDVTRTEDCTRLINSAIERYGRIDTLVCNAGYGLARAFDAMTPADVQRIFQTNLFGTIDCCRPAIGIMKRQEARDGLRGQIVIVSSACARRGLPYFSTYAATKSAQFSIAEGLRVELKPFGIAVTSVHPELVETDFFNTARNISGMNPNALAPGKKGSATGCARKIARIIVKPRRELWPKPLSRLALTIAMMIPGVTDFFIAGIRDELLRNNEMLPESTPAQPATPAQPVGHGPATH